MTIQYCSDLHLEFPLNKKFIAKHPLKPIGDVLILGGDILPFGELDAHKDFFDFVSDNFASAYWLPGNHEYYHTDIHNKSGVINEAVRSNVHLVNNQVIKLEKVQLIFSTLWSDISAVNYLMLQKRLSDFIAIRNNQLLFTPQDYEALHERDKAFITKALQLPASTPTMVVTHHLPTFLNYPAKYKKDVLNAAFATPMDELIKKSAIDYWQYGHHHFNTPKFTIGKTQLITNQLGYIKYKENGGFSNDSVIEFA